MSGEREALQRLVEAYLAARLTRRQFLKSLAVLTGNIPLDASGWSKLALLVPQPPPLPKDYAFVPERTDYHNALRQLLKDRTNTTVIDSRGIVSVEQFLDHLVLTASITKPVGDLYIGTHGNDAAWMEIRLDGQTDPNTGAAMETDYEVAETAVATGSVLLAENLNHTATGSLTSLSVNFRGCRIGAAEPFVEKLKDAFGGDSPVTAPKHFHAIYPERLGRDVGHFEYLMYSFEITNKTPFADQAAVVSAFKAKADQFKFYDGTTVPTERWDKWIPRSGGKGIRTALNVSVRLGRTIDDQEQLPSMVQFRHMVATYEWSVPLASFPAKAARLPTLRQNIHDHAQSPSSFWASTHPFPIYKRYKHTSINDFIDGMMWGFSWDSNKSEMICTGTQREYIVLVPITNPPDLATGKLIYNYSPPENGADMPVTELLTSNDNLFYTAR